MALFKDVKIFFRIVFYMQSCNLRRKNVKIRPDPFYTAIIYESYKKQFTMNMVKLMLNVVRLLNVPSSETTWKVIFGLIFFPNNIL